MFNFARFLPNEEDVNAVIDADCEDETKGENVEEIERKMRQLHGCDHGADRENERENLNQPQSPIAVKDGEEGGIKEGHQGADENELLMRPGNEIRQGKAPAGKLQRNVGHGQLVLEHFLLGVTFQGLVGGHETDCEQWIVTEIAIDQKPPT